MKDEPRIYLGNRLFRIDLTFEKLIEAGNPDNKISFEQLEDIGHSFKMIMDAETGRPMDVPVQPEKAREVRIPKSVIEEGYKEGSPFAAAFNAKFGESFNVRLLDKKALEELEHTPLRYVHRELPEIDIAGIRFIVDVAYGEIREKDSPGHALEFKKMERDDDNYVLYVDAEKQLWYEKEIADLERVKLPPMVVLDPEGIARMYGIDVKSVPSTDDQLRNNPELIKRRIEHASLPVIRIIDEDYFVDIRLGWLSSCNKHWKNIELARYEDNSGRYHIFYDYLNRRPVDIPNDITEMPKHTVLLQLPAAITMDPVAVGRRFCNDPYLHLDEFHIQDRMEARVFPLEVTFVPDLIRENRNNFGKEKGHDNREKGNSPDIGLSI